MSAQAPFFPMVPFFALVFVLLSAGAARASVALLLEQPYGGLSTTINPTGHSALYLDRVCAETPLRLRPCRAGELGAVISRYDAIDGYDWIAIPLLPYLYAVDSPAAIPDSVDRAAVDRLRNEYRRAHLAEISANMTDEAAPTGNWYELVGSAFDRTIYGFQIKSTPDQDLRLMDQLNDRENVQRYNGAFRNCADFARVTLDHYYPHAVRRNLVGDFGITTPKSVARSLTKYARKHPEVDLQVFVVPQVKGSLPRSHATQGVAQSLLTRYSVPLTLISPVLTGVVVVAYLGQGRFVAPKNAPVLNLQALNPPQVVNPQAVSLQVGSLTDQSAVLRMPSAEGSVEGVAGAPLGGGAAVGAEAGVGPAGGSGTHSAPVAAGSSGGSASLSVPPVSAGMPASPVCPSLPPEPAAVP